MNSKKKYPKWYYLILVLIPFLFFIMLEGVLRIIDYGKNLDQWISVNEKQLILNPDIAYRYFYNTKGVPYPPGDPFDKEKETNTFRVFILGGSSAAGFPYAPNGTIAKYIKKRLEIISAGKKIEVVNCAMAAVNSYTVRDLFAGVIEQKPDLIIIYAGHNEYYGALGAGSSQSLGHSPSVVNFLLSLNKYKSYHLIRDVINGIGSLFKSDIQLTGTLMRRMAKEKFIPLNSEIFNYGIEQFKCNIFDIVKMTEDANINLMLCTIASNLKDQPPFESDSVSSFPPAGIIYDKALSEYKLNNFKEADSLFLFAKELDLLRFRAPEKINQIINSFGKNKYVSIVDINSYLKKNSPHRIIGGSLMTDHLHPILRGYQLMGKKIFDQAINQKLINFNSSDNISFHTQDSLTLAHFPYSGLDSTIAKFRIIRLKHDWPYVIKPLSKNELLKLLNPISVFDSIAYKVVMNRLSWEKAHRLAAEEFLRNHNVMNYINEYNVLIDQFPQIKTYFKITSKELIKARYFTEAISFLQKYEQTSSDFFSSKWLGIIELSNGNIDHAIQYLKKSSYINGADPQTLYNLAGAYLMNKQYDNSYSAIEKCLSVNGNYPGARSLKMQVEQKLKNE